MLLPLQVGKKSDQTFHKLKLRNLRAEGLIKVSRFHQFSLELSAIISAKGQIRLNLTESIRISHRRVSCNGINYHHGGYPNAILSPAFALPVCGGDCFYFFFC